MVGPKQLWRSVGRARIHSAEANRSRAAAGVVFARVAHPGRMQDRQHTGRRRLLFGTQRQRHDPRPAHLRDLRHFVRKCCARRCPRSKKKLRRVRFRSRVVVRHRAICNTGKYRAVSCWEAAAARTVATRCEKQLNLRSTIRYDTIRLLKILIILSFYYPLSLAVIYLPCPTTPPPSLIIGTRDS